jgi:hypothetical protein
MAPWTLKSFWVTNTGDDRRHELDPHLFITLPRLVMEGTWTLFSTERHQVLMVRS